jgi:peptidoglycan/LPS O-acetylase OafA/YrhL
VFFIISGFCIHLPFVGENRLELCAFYLRRVLRLVLPLALWLPLALVLKERSLSLASLWSLWAELIYYALYPALRFTVRRVGWGAVYGTALAIAIAILVLSPVREGIPGYGPALSWALGLPVWLLGVRLAEQWSAQRLFPLSPEELWGVRLGLAAAGWLAAALHWKQVHDGFTLNAFAWLADYWLGQELLRAQKYPFPAWLVAAGAWSYSLYLTHIGVGWSVVILLGLHPPFASALALLTALGFAWLYGRFVELPAHALARRLSAIK